MRLNSMVLPYVLLVSFLTPNMARFDQPAVEAINASPYAGVAVPLIDAYDTEKHSAAEFAAKTEFLQHSMKKAVWPWVFFNRIIGKGTNTKPASNKPYFIAIKGMAINEEDEPLQDFYTIWRLALRLAKKLGAPGIFVDPEAYNNYQHYYVANVAQQQGKTEVEVQNRLEAIGAKLISIAQEEYPSAILWFTFTGLAAPIQGFREASGRLTTSSYIIKGMLDACHTSHADIKIISGGMTSLGYCYTSLKDLEEVIQKRANYFKPVLAKYPHLHLAGTIAPWLHQEGKKGWLRQGKCQKSELHDIEAFKPAIQKLLAAYQYVWIYAAVVSDYNPYQPESAARFNQACGNIFP